MEQKSRVYEELKRLGIPYKVIDHPAVFTIDEMEGLEMFHDNPWVVKNLFLRDSNGKRYFLVILDKDKKADLKLLRSQLGTSALSFASEDRLMKYLKLEKGSVTPFGILNDTEGAVEVVLDRSLVGREQIGVHPNDNTSTVMISYEDLCKVFAEHKHSMHLIEL